MTDLIKCVRSLLLVYSDQLIYDANRKQSGAKISYHLLETSRVSAANLFESNFHVFYILLFGGTHELLKNICLDPTVRYKVGT